MLYSVDYRCSVCDKKVTVRKSQTLHSLPPYLIIHQKRFDFDYNTFMKTKLYSPFTFPMRIDLCFIDRRVIHREQFFDDPSPNDYSLKGIVMHLGSSESGHYYSWIQDDPAESLKWHEFNDEVVTEIRSEEIQQMCENQEGV